MARSGRLPIRHYRDKERVMLKHAVESAKRDAAADSLPHDRKRGRGALPDSFAVMGAPISILKNVEIYGEGEPAEYVYKVVSGVVRTCKLLADGRRQISSFFLPGDIFGLEATVEHRFTAEAVSDVSLIFVKRSALTALAARDGEVANELWSAATAELRAAHEHVLLLGRKSAQERVAAFLLEMAERTNGGEAVDLPMSRLDMADYLGLTIETVSRTITQLENAAAISLPTTRRIRLRDRAALSRLNA
jgi:CRP/FNR family nitrogen fixation transcriptional regulator